MLSVITGDIVQSSFLAQEERRLVLTELKTLFQSWSKWLPIEFEIYRGDSFQAVLKDLPKSLLITLLIRAKLRSISTTNSLAKIWDARISIGIGEIDFEAEKITESDGEAFQFSGRNLDEMKRKDERIRLKTPFEQINQEFEVSLLLANAITKRWTVSQAEAIFLHLSESQTQQEIAKKLNISQKAVSQRLEASCISEIEVLLRRFEFICDKFIANPSKPDFRSGSSKDV